MCAAWAASCVCGGCMCMPSRARCRPADTTGLAGHDHEQPDCICCRRYVPAARGRVHRQTYPPYRFLILALPSKPPTPWGPCPSLPSAPPPQKKTAMTTAATGAAPERPLSATPWPTYRPCWRASRSALRARCVCMWGGAEVVCVSRACVNSHACMHARECCALSAEGTGGQIQEGWPAGRCQVSLCLYLQWW